MSKKGFVKGLAAGAVLAAVGALVVSMKDEKNKKLVKEIGQVGHAIKDKVLKHAQKLGKLSKTSYDKIVDTTVAEYRGVKLLSESELNDLKKELKSSWLSIKDVVETRRPKKAVKK